MSERHIGAVVVLYQPDDAALVGVGRLRQQVARLVVVDNTPDPDEATHEQARATGATVVANRNEGGLGRAYNTGVRRLVDEGCELVFLFDQDSEIEGDFVRRMASVSVAMAGQAYLLGPRIYEVRADAYMPDGADADDHADGLHPTEQLISSGSAVSAAAFEQLGPFREELFIEWIDVDYCYRAREARVPRWVNPGVVLRQFQGDITRHGPFLTTNHPAWRRYYLVRNGVWAGRRYVGGGAALTGGLRFSLRELVVVVGFERDKLRKVVAILAGALDGCRGRLGPLDAVRPRLAALCQR